MAIPTVTAGMLRANFPEFASAAIYPDAQVNFWIGFAYKMLPASVWTTVLPEGVQLWVCHNLVLEKQAMDAAANGGAPGVNTGALNHKQVDTVSAGYDSAIASEQNGGNYNLTTYGTRFLKISRMLGARVVQVNVGQAPYQIGAWAGPLPWPLPSGTGFSS